ncbi:ROK family transcriptional regulator [Paenibacillus sp. P96]|uniref:ROK family transcriptional regulator n=1 Tax=Paenibacillus zeirhizosphaerae TaxID=2987519 RepID=A0ABT9FKS2_9BACL|nr:ROK family transcriptional regulator [Paenibacillus sp. P96]MDP4095329.1 ROK family transcriptional regulator [Paenibacillus sp. P96]
MQVLLEKHDQEFIRKKNRMLAFNSIQHHHPISRTDIAKLSGMSAATVGRVVADLIELGLVKETDQISGGVGRKATMLDLDLESIMTVGIEVDRNLTKAALVDLSGRIIAEKQQVVDQNGKQLDVLIDLIVHMVTEMAAEQGIPLSKFVGAGVGLPGIVDPDQGMVVFSAQLGWRNISFVKMLEAKLNMPVVLDNDLKVKALGESSFHSLDGIPAESITALVSIGSGLGTALIMDQKIYRGSRNIAGEIGHSIIDPNGKLCECGKRGCLQTYITDLALLQEANQIREVRSLQELFQYMEQGEPWARSIIDRACSYIAITINNVVCAYNPNHIILTGKFIEDHPEMFEAVKLKLQEFVGEHFSGSFEMFRSKLGERSVMIGAAKLVLQQQIDYGLVHK